MGILDDDMAAVDGFLSWEETKDAAREQFAPTDQEFACYRQAITLLAKKAKTSEYDIYSNAEDEDIVALLVRQGIPVNRAWDILGSCADLWKPSDR